MSATDLPGHELKIALLQPQIAPNTGNIARLCVATGTELHLVRPMGFVLSDQKLKRSAMDYWPRLNLAVHDDDAAFFNAMRGRRLWMFSSKGMQAHWDVEYHADDVLVFGSETTGISERLLDAHRDRVVRIPQAQGERCLNLSTAAGIGLYEAMRRQNSDWK